MKKSRTYMYGWVLYIIRRTAIHYLYCRFSARSWQTEPRKLSVYHYPFQCPLPHLDLLAKKLVQIYTCKVIKCTIRSISTIILHWPICPNLSFEFGFSNFLSHKVLRHFWLRKLLYAYSYFFTRKWRMRGNLCVKGFS